MGKESSTYVEKKWYCHHCGDGPLNYRLVPSCPICYHQCCDYCQIVKLKYSTRR